MAIKHDVVPADRKEFTRLHYRGVENLTLPSFGPDLTTIDEDGLRLDIRQAVAHGFFATLLANLGHDVHSGVRNLQIMVDEAADRILIGAFAEYPTLEQNLELLKGAEAAGCHHALIGYPSALTPSSEEAVFSYFDTLINATSLGVILYASPVASLKGYDPTGIPRAVFDRLVDRPSVCAMKLTESLDAVAAYECCARYSEKLVINCVNLEIMPMLARSFGVAYSGEWIAEAAQSPEKPYVVDFVKLLGEGRIDEASELYWKFRPAYQAMAALQVPLLKVGGHPWQHIKYYQWLTGGNGGLISIVGQTPEQTGGKIDQAMRDHLRKSLTEVGIETLHIPDEQFIPGVANYKKGIRASDFRDRPAYI